MKPIPDHLLQAFPHTLGEDTEIKALVLTEDAKGLEAWFAEKNLLFPFMQAWPQQVVLHHLQQGALLSIALANLDLFHEFMEHYVALGGDEKQAWSFNMDVALATNNAKVVDALLPLFIKQEEDDNLFVFLLERGQIRTPAMLRKIVEHDASTLQKAVDNIFQNYLPQDIDPPITLCLRANRLLCLVEPALAGELLKAPTTKAYQKLAHLYESTIHAPLIDDPLGNQALALRAHI